MGVVVHLRVPALAGHLLQVAQGDAANFLCGKWCTYASWALPAQGQAGNWNTGSRNRFSGWGAAIGGSSHDDNNRNFAGDFE